MLTDVLLVIVVLCFHLAGLLFAFQAILISRTPQASIGWTLALIVVPYVTIPLFLVFGESRFFGYPRAGLGQSELLDWALGNARSALMPFAMEFHPEFEDAAVIVRRLNHLPATRGNSVRLLVDGEATFDAIFAAIEEARSYLLVQFFIIHDDEIGRLFSARLIEARERGVEVTMLIDQVGSRHFPLSCREKLRSAGVRLHSFVTNRDRGRRFRINFRNHRKLVVVDGKTAFLGGLNVGDEYMGRSKKFGPWRDTFLQIKGPAVLALQIPFLEDWYFRRREVPQVAWQAEATDDACIVMSLASGPDRAWNTCPAAFIEIIRSARTRLWMASPYFVPDQALRAAIAHAALRGVDVRILLPQFADHLLPWWSSFTFYPAMRSAGVKIYRYERGFMHQKVLLADDRLAIIGSINLDYRSFMLNFELSAIIESQDFAREVEKMLEVDFERSHREDMWAYEHGTLFFRLKARIAALLSPQQ